MNKCKNTRYFDEAIHERETMTTLLEQFDSKLYSNRTGPILNVYIQIYVSNAKIMKYDIGRHCRKSYFSVKKRQLAWNKKMNHEIQIDVATVNRSQNSVVRVCCCEFYELRKPNE